MAMSIQQLPDHVVAQIKSSTTITSLNGVVYGLVKNSLDANSSKITVSVDQSRGDCCVEDNGSGILPSEFGTHGGLGKLHCTSKFPIQSNAHGRTGTFLASVGALSLLSIASHHEGHRSHNSLRIHGSKVLARHTPALPDQRFLSFSHGTRVTVRDLFGSMPVRVKQRPAAADKASSSRDWRHLKLALVALLLPWPGQVTMTVRNASTQQTILVRNTEITAECSRAGIHPPNLVSRVSNALWQTGLSSEGSSDSWVSLQASTGRIFVSGAVCSVPVATKQLQFISIGIQPLLNEQGTNIMYEEVNRVFANSKFGVDEEAGDFEGSERTRRAQDGRYKSASFTNEELKGKKGVDRWPMFFIRVNVGDANDAVSGLKTDDLLDERHQNVQAIIEVLKAVVLEFLRKQFLRPVQLRSRNDTSVRSKSRGPHLPQPPLEIAKTRRSQSSSDWTSNRSTKSLKSGVGDLVTTRLHLPMRDRSSSRPASPFCEWSRTKCGRKIGPIAKETIPNTSKDGEDTKTSISPSRNVQVYRPLLDSGGHLVRPPFLDVEDEHTDHRIKYPDTASSSTRSASQEQITWVNPITSKKTFVDARTGFLLEDPDNKGSDLPCDSHSGPFRSGRRPQDSLSAVQVKQGSWIEAILSSWTNPIFGVAEPGIPTIHDAARLLHSTDAPSSAIGCHHGLSEIPYSFKGKVSKEALRTAEVIAQVDRKYILAKVSLNQEGTLVSGQKSRHLVIIDQHAADERCRVEGLMREYFRSGETGSSTNEARTEPLEKPLQFEVPDQEHALFERYSSHFGTWGITYQLKTLPALPSAHAVNKFRLKILHLPSSIAERCRTEPRLLIDLLRKEVWQLHENDRDGWSRQVPAEAQGNSNGGSGGGLHWLSKFHSCPQGILEMINSRACRSAIMFNDVLSLNDCQSLIERLADCILPFQCAHGRPSMVPLVDLGNRSPDADTIHAGSNFGKQYRRWRESRLQNRP